MATEREGKRVHLLPFILVTAPVFQVDTFWLNADATRNTAREGVTKKERSHPPHKQQQKGPVSNHKQTKRTKRVRLVIR